jgi:SAM-dependent methyltransferase
MRLLRLTDDFRFLLHYCRTYRSNRAFMAEHKDLRLPPLLLMYEVSGHTSRKAYYENGLAHANILARIIEKHCPGRVISVCEWGCGPGRIIRHFPDVLRWDRVDLHGTDYSPKSIEWCRENIPGVSFHINGLTPPLPFPENQFDCLYGFSVLTHLSEESHFSWIQDFRRVVKPGGLLILTTHGDLHRSKLLWSERRLYDRGDLVVRDKVEEGTRCFVAFHSPAFMRAKLLADLMVVEHLPGAVYQDLWVIRNAPPGDNNPGNGRAGGS